jgi:hypothetical protein
MRRGAFDAALRQVMWHLLKSRFLSFFFCDSVHPNSMSHETTQRKEKKKKRHMNWPTLPKKITKIGRNKFSLFWKAMHKSLCKQKEKKK